MASNESWSPPHDPLGAFCRDNHVALEPEGSGRLDRLTFAAKDLFHVKGHRTGFGNPDWLINHAPPLETAVAIQLLLKAGARMIGKTHTDELAYSLTGKNVHYGTPINPRCPDRVPGGSSNGSAVAVAGGLADFAIGSDCGGSVRIPASYCGILGVRPTHGRVPLDGTIPFASSFDVVGWFARDAETLEAVGRVLLDEESQVALPVELLVAKDAFALLETSVADALAEPVKQLHKAVGQATEVIVSPDGLRAWMECFRVLQAAEIWSNHGDWVSRAKPSLGPGIRERFEWAATIGREEVVRAKRQQDAIRERIGSLLRPGQVLCLPTSPRIAPLLSSPTDIVEDKFRYQAMCLLCIAGLGGLPQISLPLANLEGCPLGLSVLGPRGSDSQLLRLARKIMKKDNLTSLELAATRPRRART